MKSRDHEAFMKAFAVFRLAFEDHMNALYITPEPVAPAAGPALRPHGIPGWWQVWSGHTCIALLRPEDVAVLTQENGGDRG